MLEPDIPQGVWITANILLPKLNKSYEVYMRSETVSLVGDDDWDQRGEPTLKVDAGSESLAYHRWEHTLLNLGVNGDYAGCFWLSRADS